VLDRSALLAQLDVDLDVELLTLALTHRSYAYEHGGLPTNERLEFLGDSVLGVIVTERLYRTHPDLPEGQLAKLRASVVNMNALASVARELGRPADGPDAHPNARYGLGGYLYLGRGEELTGGRGKASILADATEALIGAVFLQHGLEIARMVVERLFDGLLRAAPLLGAGLDWKTSLQELTAGAELGVPEYRITEDGPDHLKTFTAVAVIGGRELGSGVGKTKKEAEQKAAELAWRSLSDAAAGSAGRASSASTGQDSAGRHSGRASAGKGRADGGTAEGTPAAAS
jgi:ribonuclease-3